MKKPRVKPFQYGKSHPRSWFEGAEALRSLNRPHLREQNLLREQLDRIEKLLTVKVPHAPVK